MTFTTSLSLCNPSMARPLPLTSTAVVHHSLNSLWSTSTWFEGKTFINQSLTTILHPLLLMSPFQLRLLVLSDGLHGCKGRPMLPDLLIRKPSLCLPRQTSLKCLQFFNEVCRGRHNDGLRIRRSGSMGRPLQPCRPSDNTRSRSWNGDIRRSGWSIVVRLWLIKVLPSNHVLVDHKE